MKRTIALVLCFAMALTLVMALSGCGPETAEADRNVKAAVCYVLANTANSQGLNLNSPIIQETVYNTIRYYGYISVVNADADPDVVLGQSFEIGDQYKGASDVILSKNARASTTDLLNGLQTVVASDPEVDYMASLTLASRVLRSLDGYDSKSIVVLGTGLSTAGVLNFQNNLLSADPDTIVEQLKEKQEIPDFSGMTVVWQHLGDTAEPQQPLTAAQRNKLSAIYEGVITAGGGTFVPNESVPAPVRQDVTYPPVSAVELPADDPIIYTPELLPALQEKQEDKEEEKPVLETPVVLNEHQVAFVADKAEYLDPEKVVEELTPLAEFLKGSDFTILLCGTTAGDETTASSIALSLARAEAVKQSLVDLGVEPERIIAVGLGSSDPWHIYGVGYNGPAAAENRKVVLLDAASETGSAILAQQNA